MKQIKKIILEGESPTLNCFPTISLNGQRTTTPCFMKLFQDINISIISSLILFTIFRIIIFLKIGTFIFKGITFFFFKLYIISITIWLSFTQLVFQIRGFIFKGGHPMGRHWFWCVCGGGGRFKKIIRWGGGQMCNPTTDSKTMEGAAEGCQILYSLNILRKIPRKFVSTLVLSIALEHFISAKHYSIY